MLFIGKLVAIFFLTVGPLPAQEPAGETIRGRATIQLKNASYRSDLGRMDLVLAPTNLIPEIRRLRMETWRTDGLAVTRAPARDMAASLRGNGPRGS